MWQWFVSIGQAYWAWVTSWVGPENIATHPVAGPIIMTLVTVACARFGYLIVWDGDTTSAKVLSWRSFRGLFFGSVVGSFLGFVVVLFFFIPAALAPLALASSLVLAIVSLSQQVYGPARRCISSARLAARGLFRTLRRKLVFRKKSSDYLEELDESALETERRLGELLAQQDALQSYAKKCETRIHAAEEVRGDVPAQSAAAQIAGELRMKFESEQRSAVDASAALTPLIAQIRQGQAEMSCLVTLARLCRESREVTAEHTRALEAARTAYAAMKKAFEQADAVLLSAALDADLDVGLAYRQSDDALRRSVQLSDAHDSVVAQRAVRVRA